MLRILWIIWWGAVCRGCGAGENRGHRILGHTMQMHTSPMQIIHADQQKTVHDQGKRRKGKKKNKSLTMSNFNELLFCKMVFVH